MEGESGTAKKSYTTSVPATGPCLPAAGKRQRDQVFSIRKARKAPREGKRDWNILSINLPVNTQNALSNGNAKTAPFATVLYPNFPAIRFSSWISFCIPSRGSYTGKEKPPDAAAGRILRGEVAR